MAGRSALMRTGEFSPEEAERRMFAGQPQTETGQALLQFQRTNPLTRLLLPFVRTQTNIMEQGVERMDPRRFFNAETPDARRLAAGQLGLSGLAAILGAQVGDDYTAALPFAAAAAGPYALPFMLGSAYGVGKDGVNDEVEFATRLGSKFSQQLPLASDYALNPSRLLASYVPNILRDVNPDDQARETKGTIFGPAAAKIPGLSTTLPAKRERRKKRRRD
jgi:hypothetical protein